MHSAMHGPGAQHVGSSARGSENGCRIGVKTRRRRVVGVESVLVLVSLAVAQAGQFHPNKSTSFRNEEQLFKVEYLDDASLTGFVAEDIVQLGDYYVSTRFGCVTDSKGHDWAQADGILGMGFPAAALRSVPFPLFWALTDPTRTQQQESNVLENRIFTLMLSEDRGELVLGGHDPKSVQGEMVTTAVRASPLPDGSAAFMHYMIDVQSLKVGGHELLQFRDESIAIQAILDSGTSCLVVPDDTFEGGLLASPFKEFQKHFGELDEPTIHITIEGQTFSLPYDDYMVDDKPCVMKMKSTPRTFLLGDVFFRRMVVVHNLNNPMQPLVTLGQRDPGYRLTTQLQSIGQRNHVPLGKKQVKKLQPETVQASKQPLPEHEHEGLAGRAGSSPGGHPSAYTQGMSTSHQAAPPAPRQPVSQVAGGGGWPGQQPQTQGGTAQQAAGGWQGGGGVGGGEGGEEGGAPMFHFNSPPGAQAQAQAPPQQQQQGEGAQRMPWQMQPQMQPRMQPQMQMQPQGGPPQGGYPQGAGMPAGQQQAGVGVQPGLQQGMPQGGYPPQYAVQQQGVYPPGMQGGAPSQGFAESQQAGGYGQGGYGGLQGMQQPMIQPQAPPQAVPSMSSPRGSSQQEPMVEEDEQEPPLHNPSLGGGPHRRVLGASDVIERVPMTTSNSYIYYAQLAVGTPRQRDIHVILDTGSSVFAIFAVPHGGPSLLVICLLVAACILGATSIGLLALSWYQGRYEEMQEGTDPLLDDHEGEHLPSKA